MTATREARTPAKLPPQYLTPREQEITELVWRGLGNAAIARELFISPKVVEAHVVNARRKVGAANRVQLALWWERKLHADYSWSLQPMEAPR